ncbi:MAG TPA: DUF3096 domain-containing protein [Dokdonella sp.]|nr:DUF3096 domain-containing protein [Dokdonella sp.]
MHVHSALQLIALAAGILILIRPRLPDSIVAPYPIIVGRLDRVPALHAA